MLAENDLLLHIGMPKTGTSSIQAALAETRDLCAQDPDAVLYPQAATFQTGLAHHLLAQEIREPHDGSRPAPQMRAVATEIRQRAPRAVILSSEEFADPPAARVTHSLRAGLDPKWALRAIVYVRSPATSLLSLADQNVSKRWDSPGFEGVLYHNAAEFFLDRMLQEWRSALSGKLAVRPFARGQMRNDNATEDFFAQIFGADHPASAAAAAIPRKNVGRNPALVLLIDRTRPLLKARLEGLEAECAAQDTRLMRILTEELAPSCAGVTARLRLSREVLEICHAASIEGTRRVDDMFFDTPVLAPELEALMDTVPHDQTLLTAEEALGLSRQQVQRICVAAARKTERRFRRVLARLADRGRTEARP